MKKLLHAYWLKSVQYYNYFIYCTAEQLMDFAKTIKMADRKMVERQAA